MTTRITIMNHGPLPVDVRVYQPAWTAGDGAEHEVSKMRVRVGEFLDTEYVHAYQKVEITEALS